MAVVLLAIFKTKRSEGVTQVLGSQEMLHEPLLCVHAAAKANQN